MTSSNQTTDPETEVAAHKAHADNIASPVSSIADTESNGLTEPSQSESGAHSKYPTWLLDLAHQLRHFRQWRLIIKPDQTLDLDYLATLALHAQRKARPQTAPPQLSLFALEPVAVNPETAIHDLHDQTTIEITPMTSMLALNHAPHPAAVENTSSVTLAPFTIINGNNRQTLPNTIILPDEILTIEADEELHEYLSRVAAAAMEAAISACGSKEAAFIRLGSKATQERSAIALPLAANRPTLVLAPAREQTQTTQQPGRRTSRS